jgi:hypothetical protein
MIDGCGVIERLIAVGMTIPLFGPTTAMTVLEFGAIFASESLVKMPFHFNSKSCF